MLTVYLFMMYTLARANVKDHFKFNELSDKHLTFWLKLTRLHIDKGISSEVKNNVDKATVLTPSEWDALDEELKNILN